MMSTNGTESEISDSFFYKAYSYGSFISDLSATVPPLRALDSLDADEISDIDAPTLLSEFALLLSTLRVPGPADLFKDKILLGSGAHFTVFKQEVTAFGNSRYAGVALQNGFTVLAVKQPNFMLGSQQKLDLSDPENCRQLRSMILEITALCHPRLRGHPNIVDLLAWGINTLSWHQVPFIALELANENLSSFLRCWTDISVTFKNRISLEIACGLDAIHDVGIVHGDVKPDNVLMFLESDNWTAKLADFGGATDVGKSGIWECRGTVGWQAPELCMHMEHGTQLDRSVLDRIDVYSYGLLLWSIFLKENGEVPYGGYDGEAEHVALMDLRNNLHNFSTSLGVTLKLAFGSLLNSNPHLRKNTIADLLDDSSKAFRDWTKKPILQPCASDEDQVDQEGTNHRFNWELTEISNKIAYGLKNSFLKHQHFSCNVLHALTLKLLSYGRNLDLNINDKTFLLDILCTNAQQNDGPSKSMIYRIYDYFDIPAPPNIRAKKVRWIAEAISDGALFLRAELQQLDNELCRKSVGIFRESGGYNRFYASLPPMSFLDIAQYTSKDELTNSHITKSLNSRGDSVLHILSSYDQAEVLWELLKRIRPEDINQLNAQGETPLYRACMVGLTQNVLQLLSCGADSSIKPSVNGPGCLHWLFHFDPCDVHLVAEKLVKNGASIHAQSKQKIPMLYFPFVLPMGTSLHWAVEMSALEAVAALLLNGADPLLRDESDPYEYDQAVRHLNMVLPPDENRISVAQRPTMGMNALDLAVKNRDYRILEILLSAMPNAIVDQTDEEGYTALHRLDAGHWLHTKHGTAIWKPFLQGSMIDQKEGLRRTVAVLLENGVFLDKLTQPQELVEDGVRFSRKTAMMLALKTGHLDTVQVLMETGADVDVANDEDRTALFMFGSDNYQPNDVLQSKMITLLLSAYPNIHKRDVGGYTPLLVAAELRLTEVVSALLQHGADLCDRPAGANLLLLSGRSVLGQISNCRLDEVRKHDEWLCTILTQYVIPCLRDGSDEMRDKILNKAGVNGGSLLHFFAQNGLVRCCEILLNEACVEINPIWKGKKIRRRGLVTHFRTPLDEALKHSNAKPHHWDSEFSKRDYAQFLGVFDETAKLLQSYGGVRAKTLVTKEFNPTIPPTFDLKYPNNAL